ncbi:MAG: hypothetical protein PHR45_05065 [Muribaculaceae bacterium]|nr:hypothetical protein [Muribaculaceae bacterium]
MRFNNLLYIIILLAVSSIAINAGTDRLSKCAITKQVESEPSPEKFINSFFHKYVWGKYTLDRKLAKKYLTTRLAKRLLKDYAEEYDGCDDCFAVWNFRPYGNDGGNDDGVVKVAKINNTNWYAVTQRYCGKIFVLKVKLIKSGDSYKFDQIKE